MKVIKDLSELSSSIEITRLKNIMDNCIIGFDYNLTWDENNLDDLDQIELIMKLEKEFYICIPDHISEQIMDNKPIVLLNSIINFKRNHKLDILLYEKK